MSTNIHKELMGHGLSYDEYSQIKHLLNREPNRLELGMFSAMWSEHCSYKSSKALLKKLPTGGSHILQGPGENAGVVDIGEGLAVVMKIESHNHPSFIEPFQGAATGVGGIIRDILAMGAEPIALLNSLRFGLPEKKHTQYLFDKVVEGIAFYGNCVGVPTVGGEVYFHESYEHNPLVNVMCVGLAKKNTLKKAIAHGPGNPVIYVGALTGPDGIHGASFASKNLHSSDFDKSQKQQVPHKTADNKHAIQIANPFMAKLLIEGILEISQKDYVIGIQDMGAAGLTSSTSEMSSRGSCGMKLDLSLVPVRDTSMSASDIMLSESQERMIIVVKKGYENDALKIFTHWGLHSAIIGEVLAEESLEIYFQGKKETSMPVKALTEGFIMRELQSAKRPPKKDFLKQEISPTIDSKNANEYLLEYLRSSHGASRRPIYQQYDSMVKTNTVRGPGQSDAAIIRIKGSKKALAFTTDCNSRYCAYNPYVGSQIAVLEAARNLSVVGAKPLAVTDGLNFGDPNKEKVYWQLEQSILGIKAACEVLELPVISGNVSLYNESATNAILPTPIIGMLGLIDDVDCIVDMAFKQAGDSIILFGGSLDDFSLHKDKTHKKCSKKEEESDELFKVDLHFEKRLQEVCRCLAHEGLVNSAHDLSEGGLAVALAESCLAGGYGIHCDFPTQESAFRSEEMSVELFQEKQSRIIISVNKAHLARVSTLFESYDMPYDQIGFVTDQANFIINNDVKLSLSTLQESYSAMDYGNS